MYKYTYFEDDDLREYIEHSKFNKISIHNRKLNHSIINPIKTNRLNNLIINLSISIYYCRDKHEFIKFLLDYQKLKTDYFLLQNIIKKIYTYDSYCSDYLLLKQLFRSMTDDDYLSIENNDLLYLIIKHNMVDFDLIQNYLFDNRILMDHLTNYTDEENKTLLHLVFIHRPQDFFINEFIKYININNKDNKGNTPLHYIVGRISIHHKWIDTFKCCVNIKNNECKTPLDIFINELLKNKYNVLNCDEIYLKKLIKYTNCNEHKSNNLRMLLNKYKDFNLRILKYGVNKFRYIKYTDYGIMNKIFNIVKIFIDENTPISNGIINLNLQNYNMNPIIKLLIKNGLVIPNRSNVNEKIKQYYKGYLINKIKCIHDKNIFIPDIINIICQY